VVNSPIAHDRRYPRGKQGERASLERHDDSKVALVEGQDSPGVELPSQHRDREVRLVPPRRKVLKERASRQSSEALAEEVVDLSGHRRWDEQLAALGSKNLEDLVASRLALIRECD